MGIRYTYLTALPHSTELAEASIRKRVKKACRLGYTAERSEDWGQIHHCLLATESVKSFNHSLTVARLERASHDVGKDAFRGYVVKDTTGQVVSGGIRLLSKAGNAYDWVQGARRESLGDGVNQLMYKLVLDDLARAGATTFDFGGANIREVARAKATWNLELRPYLTIGAMDLRYAKSSLLGTYKWVRTSRASSDLTAT